MNSRERLDILLVEDNPRDAELVMRGLRKHKPTSEIVWVKDGAQALDYVYRSGEFADRSEVDPRLILLDLQMPKVDGREVTRTIKSDERTRHIPIVVMTSSDEQRDVIDLYRLGANSYVVKPLDFDALAQVTSLASFYWLAINRVAD